jgi:8-oxo-dGTP pyrophosphatase MutT (NUDIX family)
MSQFGNVGRGPAFPVSVKGVAVQYGQVLLLENERAEWELPGGKLELGEDPQECVAREIREETEWQVRPGPILDCWQYHIRENYSVVIVTYGCHVVSNRPPVVSTEHKRARLFALADVPRLNMPAGYKRSVTDWFNRLDSPGPHLTRYLHEPDRHPNADLPTRRLNVRSTAKGLTGSHRRQVPFANLPAHPAQPSRLHRRASVSDILRGRRRAMPCLHRAAWEVPVSAGPEEGPATGRGHLRAADSDREHVIDLLKAAFVQARLTKDELDSRTGRALTARTYAELGTLTADIPAGPPTAWPQSRPTQAHPVRNAAIGSASCLTVALLAFCYGASLDDQHTPLFLLLAFLAVMAVPCIIAYTAAGSVGRSRSRRQLPPRPGQDGQAPALHRYSSTGDDSSPPGARTDQTHADLRAHQSRQGRPRPCRQGIPVPNGARPAPGMA